MGRPDFYSPEAARWVAGFVVSSLGWGIAFGAAATAKVALPFAAAMSALMFSGTAQLASIQLWGDPLPLATILLAVFSVNSRYLAMGASLAPLYAGRTAKGLAGTALLTDASWLLTLRAAREGLDPHAVLITANLLMWTSWVAGTVIGGIAGYLLPELLLGALGWLVLALLASLLPPMIQGWRSAAGVVAAALLAILLDSRVAGSWDILLAGLAGAAVSLVLGTRRG